MADDRTERFVGEFETMDRPGYRHDVLSELRRRNAELAEAVSARDQFIAVAAHELRNPMAALYLRPASDPNRPIAWWRRSSAHRPGPGAARPGDGALRQARDDAARRLAHRRRKGRHAAAGAGRFPGPAARHGRGAAPGGGLCRL